MVPKVAKGGGSFIGAGGYYLGEGRRSPADQEIRRKAVSMGGIASYVLGEGRDPGHSAERQHAGRVGFTTTRHLPTADARLGFMLMQGRYQAYREERVGKRGRPLTEPVYSYSLSWAPGEAPDRREMEFAAETSLTVLGMEAHQAVIVEHRDKSYAHVHVVVNRVHPRETRAVHTSMDQFKLSRWAEAFEHERGQVWCERRVENNALRDTGVAVKDMVSRSRSEIEAEREGAAAEIAAWRIEQDALRREEHREGARALWEKQQGERLALEARTRKLVADGRQAISNRHKPAWRALYKAERDHVRHIKVNRRGILERAVHAFVHARALGFGERLSAGEIAVFALSEKALLERVAAVTQVQRSALSERQLGEIRSAAKAAWSRHHEELAPMKERHKVEREALDRENRADWVQLRNIRDAGLDGALFKVEKNAEATLKGEPKAAAVSAFSIKRLTGVWQVFRDKLSVLDRNQMVVDPIPTAVPDRPTMREIAGKISASPSQSRREQDSYEHER